MKVRDVMTSEVVSVPPDTRLKDLARVFSERRISGAPVVDEERSSASSPRPISSQSRLAGR